MSEGPAKPQERCARCGTPLREAPGGPVCPRCLLALALDQIPTPPELAASTTAAQLFAGPVVIGKDVPEHIGPYHLLQILGTGGMGIVFLAEQERPLTRRVALKLVKRGMDSKEVLARFESERQALALMSHTGIARVYDAGTSEDGLPYFVMEHVAGTPITEYCDRNRLSARQRLELFVEVCEAVQHAHTKGIIHRDIKPSNVLVAVQESRPLVKVIDFGVAKATSQRLTEKTLFTQLGVMIGTPGYISPEQTEVSGPDVDTRSDIYSLGVLAYELLVGELPFDAGRLRRAAWGELQRILQEEEPPRPSMRVTALGVTAIEVAVKRGTDPLGLARELRGDLDWITLKALEKDRTRRYQSASELAADIRRHLADEPVVAGPPGLGYRLGKAIRRHRLLFASAAAVASAILVGLVVTTVQYLRAEAARRETSQQVVRLHVAAGMRLADEGDPSGALPFLVEALRLEEERTREESHRLRLGFILRTVPKPIRMWFHEGQVEAAFNPSQTAVVTAGTDGTARIWSVSTGEPLSPPLRHEGAVTDVAFSPDGKRLVTASEDSTARIWDASTGQPLQALKHQDRVNRAVFSPDGSRIATASADDTGGLWETSSGRRLATLSHGGDVHYTDFSPDGTLVLTASEDGARLWDGHTGVLRQALRHGAVWRGAFSPDGTRIITAEGGHLDPGDARIWSTASGRALTPLLPHAELVNGVAFSPDGRRVLTMSRTSRVWDGVTGAPVTPPLETGSAMAGGFSPDGRVVVVGNLGGAIQVRDAATGDLAGAPLTHGGGINSVRFDATGRFLLSAGDDATVKLWDLAAGEEPLPAFEHPDSVTRVEFSSDGESLLTGSFGLRTSDSYARVWNARSGDPATPPMRHGGKGLVRASFSPDGRLVATGGADGIARLWDVATGEPTTARLRHPTLVTGLAYSPDGRRIATISAPWSFETSVAELRVWDVARGVSLFPALRLNGTANALKFSPDGQRVVTGERDGMVRIWDSGTGRALGSLSGHSAAVSALSFSPDGHLIASASDDGTARVWDASSGHPLVPPLSLAGQALHVGFSADGSRLVTATTGGVVRQWDLRNGKSLGTAVRHQELITTATFSRDGRWLLTSSADRTARVWDAHTSEPVTPAIRHRDDVLARFAPDATRLITASQEARIWAFVPDATPLDDLARLASALSSRAVEPLGGLVPLEPADLRRAWEGLTPAGRRMLEARPEQVQGWHRRQGLELLRDRRFAEAVAHLDTVLATRPRRWRDLTARAFAHAELGRWADSASDYAAALDTIPGELDVAYDLGLVHLVCGDATDFERLRHSLIAGWSHTQNPDRARWAAQAMVLAPIRESSARAQALTWAEMALEVEPEHPEWLALRGAALFRAGRFREALKALTVAVATGAGGQAGSARASVFAFLALTRGALGNPAEARHWRATALARLRALERPAPVSAFRPAGPFVSSKTVAWREREELRVLLKEVDSRVSPGWASPIGTAAPRSPRANSARPRTAATSASPHRPSSR